MRGKYDYYVIVQYYGRHLNQEDYFYQKKID